MNIQNFSFEDALNIISGIVWGPITLILLLVAGIYLTFGLKGFPFFNLGYGFKSLFKKSKTEDDGEISSFDSLMTALSATVGTGNISGVATAIFLGGPGAIFWMWVTALFGMATKYAEAFLAIKYREKNVLGSYVGGPMYYIKNGLAKKYHFLAYFFAFFGMIAAFGIGNSVQSNSVAQVLSIEFGISKMIIGLVIAALVSLVIFLRILKNFGLYVSRASSVRYVPVLASSILNALAIFSG